MEESRFIDIYNTIISQLHFNDYILNNKDKLVDECDLDILQAVYGGFCLTMFIDEYLLKQASGDRISEIHPEPLKQLTKIIAQDNGTGYDVGDLKYADETKVLTKVRNKLAHGDYSVKNGEIIFRENGAEARIGIKEFLVFLSTIDASVESITLNQSYTKNFDICKNMRIYEPIKNERDFKNVCENMYRLEIIDEPIEPKTRDAHYEKEIEKIYAKVNEFIYYNQYDKIKKYLYEKKEELVRFGIDLKHSITRFTELNYYNELLQNYIEEKEIYDGLSKREQVEYISNSALRMVKKNNFDIRKSIQLLELILRVLKNDNEISLEQAKQTLPELKKIFLYHKTDIILSAYLSAFNSIYSYGLETGFTKPGVSNYHIIFEGLTLDFSKLNINFMDDPNMSIERDPGDFQDEIKIYEIDKMSKIDAEILRKEQKFIDFSLNPKVPEKIVQQAKEALDNEKANKAGLQTEINEFKAFEHALDNDKYKRNVSILIHLRNAIAHGNVTIEKKSSDVLETEVCFRDYTGGHTGDLVYEKKVKIKDFIRLFDDCNICQLLQYVTNNIEDKNQINLEYCDELTHQCKQKIIQQN